RRRFVASRLPSPGDPAIGRRPVAHDDPACLVGVSGTGVIDELLHEVRRQGDRRRAGVSAAHHQLTPPSRSDSISTRSRENVPAERYFQPPSGSSATIVPRSIRFASRAAATSTAPHDGPPKIPSLNTRSRSAAIASRLDTRYLK